MREINLSLLTKIVILASVIFLPLLYSGNVSQDFKRDLLLSPNSIPVYGYNSFAVKIAPFTEVRIGSDLSSEIDVGLLFFRSINLHLKTATASDPSLVIDGNSLLGKILRGIGLIYQSKWNIIFYCSIIFLEAFIIATLIMVLLRLARKFYN